MCQSQLDESIPRRSPEIKDTTIAVDMAKDVFEIAVAEEPGVVDEKQRLTRERLLRFFANRQATTVVMKACGSRHHWVRELDKLGRRAVRLPPHEAERLIELRSLSYVR